MRTSLNINFHSLEDYEKFTSFIEGALLNYCESDPEYIVDTEYRKNANGGKTILVTKNPNFKEHD